MQTFIGSVARQTGLACPRGCTAPGAAITKFVTFYATNHEVDSQTHHVNRYELSQCPGIMNSYSYFALQKDVVLQRRFDCNCHACCVLLIRMRMRVSIR